jgi:CheY-like chemotaxis protein
VKTLKVIKVLIVEDDPVSLEGLDTYLRLNGHDTCTASDGTGALVAVEAFKPDVMVVDHLLPTLNGFDFIRKIREHPTCRGLPVVLITALAGGPELEGMYEALPDIQPARLLRKPFDPPSLLKAIREMPRSSDDAGVGPEGPTEQDGGKPCRPSS